MRVAGLGDPCVNLTSSHLSRKQSEAQKLRLPRDQLGWDGLVAKRQEPAEEATGRRLTRGRELEIGSKGHGEKKGGSILIEFLKYNEEKGA